MCRFPLTFPSWSILENWLTSAHLSVMVDFRKLAEFFLLVNFFFLFDMIRCCRMWWFEKWLKMKRLVFEDDRDGFRTWTINSFFFFHFCSYSFVVFFYLVNFKTVDSIFKNVIRELSWLSILPILFFEFLFSILS